MKSSIYNYFLNFNNQYYVFNTASGALLSFDSENKIEEIKTCLFSSLSFDEIEILTKMRIIVKEEENEFKTIKKENNSLLKNHKEFNLTIFTTTDCNAKCPYCFEKNIRKEYLNKSKADEILSFITNNSVKKVALNWFGGEPLLNSEIIKYFCEKLSKENVVFNSSMTTNGYLIEENIQILKLANVKSLQITLDGVFEEYENVKQYGDLFSFKKVIKNIHLVIANKIRVSVRLNFDKNNIYTIMTAIDYLSEEFSEEEKNYLSVYGHHIFGNCNPQELKPLYNSISDKLFEKGFITKINDLAISRKISFCGIRKENHFTIMPNGAVYKCEHFASDGLNQIGTFDKLNNKTEKQKNYTRCEKCLFFPVCAGGCEYYANQKLFVDCCNPIRYYFDNLLKKMIIIKEAEK